MHIRRLHDVEDALAAVLISVHSNGTHVAAPTNSQQTNAAKIERVKRPHDLRRWIQRRMDILFNPLARIRRRNANHWKGQSVTTTGMLRRQPTQDITRNAGGSLANKTVEQVLEAVKKLAVREENAMVARVQLSDMKQDRDEAIRNFGARLRGQASVCKFTTACPSCNTAVNYSDNILRDILIKGLADNEIQLDLLGDKNQDMSLEEVFQFVEAKEARKRSAGRLPAVPRRRGYP